MGYLEQNLAILALELEDSFRSKEIERFLSFYYHSFSINNLSATFLHIIDLARYLIREIKALRNPNELIDTYNERKSHELGKK